MSVSGRVKLVEILNCEKKYTRTSISKLRLLHTVSLVAVSAILACAPMEATANGNQGRFIVEFSGSVYSGDQQPWNQFSPNNFNTIGPGPGLNGMIGYIGPLGGFSSTASNGWNIGVFARFGSSNRSTEGGYNYPYYNILGGSFSTPYDLGKATHREEHLIVDFEARRDVGIGSLNNSQTTLTGGIRFARFEANTDTTFVYLPITSYLWEKRRFSFTGIGPKFGLEHKQPLNPYISFDMSGSASVLYGRRSTKVTTTGCGCAIGNSTSIERSDWVPMLDGRLGFTFGSPGSSTRLSIGVEANAWFGVYDQRAAFTFGGAPIPGNRNADRFSYGPYVRLTTLLGGLTDDTFALAKNDYDNMSNTPERQPILEVGAWGGHLWRFGNALNSSGATKREIEDFSLGGVELLAAMPFASNWLAQFEIHGEATFDNNRFESMLADDTYGGGYLAGGHLAFVTDNALFGLFGGVGRTEINSNDTESLDTQFEFGGVEGRFLSTHGSIAIQTGFINTKVIDGNESLNDAVFARAIGQLFFNDGKTMLQGDVSYSEGLQDTDDFVPNPASLFAWGVELEQQLPMSTGFASTSLFASYEGILVAEDSTDGGVDRVGEHTLLAGIKIRFGAATPYERAFNSAPDLPNVLRWLGTVPAVD